MLHAEVLPQYNWSFFLIFYFLFFICMATELEFYLWARGGMDPGIQPAKYPLDYQTIMWRWLLTVLQIIKLCPAVDLYTVINRNSSSQRLPGQMIHVKTVLTCDDLCTAAELQAEGAKVTQPKRLPCQPAHKKIYSCMKTWFLRWWIFHGSYRNQRSEP